MKKEFLVGILVMLVFGSVVSGEFLLADKTNDEVSEARSGPYIFVPMNYKYQIITGIADDEPEPGPGDIIVNITHDVDIAQVVYVTAIMYNETTGLGFTQGCSMYHPKGSGGGYMGLFMVFFDETNVYIHAPGDAVWGSHYTIVFFYDS